MFPFQTNASLLSVFGLDTTPQAYAESRVPEQNSQTIPLLVAYQSPTQTSDTDISTVTISDGALKSDIGPLGTLSEVEEYVADSDQISIYVVREGDSLSAIADMFGVSTNTVLWANDMKKGDSIKRDQILTILPITGIQHTVKKGETIASIAKSFKGDVREISQYNGLLADETLKTGTVVFIPDGEIAPPPVKKAVASSSKKEKTWGTTAPSQNGYYIRPLSGGRKSQGLHGYNGIDIAASTGTPVYASAGGTVILARSGGWGGGYGSYVVIKHSNGTQTLYAHLSKVSTTLGATVSAGETIGAVGNTGRSTGPHLHFEIRGAKNPF